MLPSRTLARGLNKAIDASILRESQTLPQEKSETMLLKNSEWQRLLLGLQAIEKDDALKLALQVRQKLAINAERILPIVATYERTCQRNMTSVMAQYAKPAEREQALVAANADNVELGDTTHEVEVYSITRGDLNLGENIKIKFGDYGKLRPMISDFDKID
jgi:hypothetical protein